jgi:uncharacterized protein YaaW (UPF0174 family)
MSRSISMRDLQKMSARAIQALPHAVPIKNGSSTVGVLLPIHSASRDYLLRVLDQIAAAAEQYTADEKEAVARLIAERGID